MLKTAPYKFLPDMYVIVQNGTHQVSSKGKIFPLHSTKCAFKTHQSALKAMNKLIEQEYVDLKIYHLEVKTYLSNVMPFNHN